MHLKLLDEGKAVGVFGLPGRDCLTEEIAADYAARGWPDEAIRTHVECAINAGAYAVAAGEISAEKSAPQIVTIDPRDGVNAQEASAAAQVLHQRKREVKHGE